MQWSEEQKTSIQTTSKLYLDKALECFDTASILLDNDKFQHSCQFLQNSLRAVIDCYFTVYGVAVPEDDQQRVAQFQKINQQSQLMTDRFAQTPQAILALKAEQFQTKGTSRSYEKLFDQYADLLHRLHFRYNQLLRTDLATQDDLSRFAKQRKVKQGWLLGVMATIVLGIVGLYVHYTLKSPSNYFVSQMQFFWVADPNTKFNAEHQQLIRIKGNGAFAEYQITINPAQPVARLRLDPTDLLIETAEVDFIEMADSSGNVVHRFDFNRGDPAWQPVNSEPPSEPDGTWALEPTNTDLYIISPPFPQKEVQTIRVRARLVDPVPFWKWLLAPNHPEI